MTKEENIATLNEHLDHWKRLSSEKICDQSEGEKTIDALQNAIKALEQEPVLDKIRAEIDSYCSDNRDRNDGLYIAMRIIDKYQESMTVAEGSEE